MTPLPITKGSTTNKITAGTITAKAPNMGPTTRSRVAAGAARRAALVYSPVTGQRAGERTPSPPSGLSAPTVITSSPSGPGHEVADDFGGDADYVPLAQLDDLVLELDPAGTADGDVGLLLHFGEWPSTAVKPGA